MPTDKQQRFIQEYIIDRNGTQAAIRAGYSKRTAGSQAARLLTKANIKAAIDAHMQAARSKALASAHEVEEYLTKVMRGETISTVIVVEGKWDGVSVAREFTKRPDERERLEAAKVLAKRHNLTDSKTVANAAVVLFSGEGELE